MKNSELGIFWLSEKIANLRKSATGARKAYKTDCMTRQTFAYADACDEAATVMERHLAKMKEDTGRGAG